MDGTGNLPLLCFHVSRPGRRADDGHGTAAAGPRRTLPTGAWQLPLLEDSFSLFSSRKGRRRSFTEEQRVLDTATGINLRSVAKMGSGHLFCPPRLTGGRPARPATGAPAAGNWFTAVGNLTCPPQEIVIYRGGRYESPAAVNTVYHGGLFKLSTAVKT